MSRLGVNRSGELEVFVRVVEHGGFSAAARACGMTPSAVSKLVARLEARLGARLLNRSTRKLQLTQEGVGFYDRGVQLLADLDDAERSAARGRVDAGRLRVTVSVPVGLHVLLPLVPAFVARHPDIVLDVSLTDLVVDLLDDRSDVAIRSGAMANSGLVARKLGETRMMIVGAPSYLARSGTPGTAAELEAHNRIGFSYKRAVEGWPLIENGARTVVPSIGSVQVSDGEAMRRLAVAGVGLARLAAFLVRADIDAGRLVPVLEDCNPGETEAVHAVFLGQGGHLPARVRTFLDFLGQRMRIR